MEKLCSQDENRPVSISLGEKQASFSVGSTVLIGQVATNTDARGRGYAREFLKWLAKFFNGLGKRAYLLALDVRVSFYKEIGFKVVGQEIVLERIDVVKDNVTKGRLVG